MLLEGEDNLLLQPKCVAVKGKGVMSTYVYQPSAGVPGQPGPAPHAQVQGRLHGDAAPVAGQPARLDPLDPGMDPDPATHADNDVSAAAAASGSSILQSDAGSQPRSGPGESSYTGHQFHASMDGAPGGSSGRCGGPGSSRIPLPLPLPSSCLMSVAAGGPRSTHMHMPLPSGIMAVAAAAGGPGCPVGFQQLVGQIVRAKVNLLSRSPSTYANRPSMPSMPRTGSTVWHGKGDDMFSLAAVPGHASCPANVLQAMGLAVPAS